VERLRAFARAAKFLPILVQADPDPDGIASAMAVRALLRRRPATMPIVTLGQVTRPENRRFVELMGIEVERVTRAELRRYEHLIAVDVQPGGLGPLPARIAVIDHHPPEAGYSAMFRDIRPENGATATMLTQYLRADETCRLSRRLATALLYGIQTDTALLTRGARPEDVLAYVFLQTRADAGLLRRIARPSYGPALARAFGATLAHLAVDGDLVVGFAGRVEGASVHLLVDLADFCLSIAGAAWVVVGGVVEQELVLALRRAGGPPGAGTLARRIARGGGSGGGHASMARARLPIETVRRQLGDPPSRWTAKAISRIVRAELDRIG